MPTLSQRLTQWLFFSWDRFFTPQETSLLPHYVNVPNRTGKLTFFCSYFLDILVIMLMISLFVLFLFIPSPRHYFRLDDVQLMKPLPERETIPIWLSAVLNIALPFCLLLFLQMYCLRNIFDWLHSFIGLAQSISLALLLTSFLWVTVGGLRPFTLTVCMPDTSRVQPNITYYTLDICTQSFQFGPINTPAFPSGHATIAFATWVFIAWYLSAKIKVYDGYGHFYKVFFFIIPLFFAIWQSYTRVLDHVHFEHQILAGALIGTLSAIVSYRNHYCALIGSDNHIPSRMLWGKRAQFTPPTIPSFYRTQRVSSSDSSVLSMERRHSISHISPMTTRRASRIVKGKSVTSKPNVQESQSENQSVGISGSVDVQPEPPISSQIEPLPATGPSSLPLHSQEKKQEPTSNDYSQENK